MECFDKAFAMNGSLKIRRTCGLNCEIPSFVILIMTFFVIGRHSALAQMNAYRVEDVSFIISTSDEGVVTIQAGHEITLRLISTEQFSPDTEVSFTSFHGMSGEICDDMRSTEIFRVSFVNANSALVKVLLRQLVPPPPTSSCCLMFCLRQKSIANQSSWIHQGNSSWMQLAVAPDSHKAELLPMWAKCCLIIFFLCISGIFSALALILLSLTRAELKVLRNRGSSKERRYAKTLAPLRKRGNCLLCALLLINTLANVIVAVLLYDFIGFYALIAATFSITLFGEILPQTIASWFGLAIGVKTVWFTNIFIILTFPFSYPISKLMDLILANEIPSVYKRDRLHQLLKTSTSAENDGKVGKATVTTLDLSTKSIKDIMTKLENVYMVEYNSVLTFDVLNKILKSGFTRIPVYETERTNVVALLHVKDLALLDPDVKMTLKMLCKFYNHPVNFVFEDTKLNVMLEEFKRGQSHMAFIQRVNSEGVGDPFYETLGMVTLEDVIEDIFQSEITDESSVILENRELLVSMKKTNVDSFPDAVNAEKENKVSQKLIAAAQCYLSSSVVAFHPEQISEKVLKNVIEQNSVVYLKLSDPLTSCCIFENGKSSDYFVMILSGQVEIDIGKESFVFSEGPFAFFGLQVLTDAIESVSKSLTLSSISEKVNAKQLHYIPDFTVRATTDVQYLRISKAVYSAALRATLVQYQQQSFGTSIKTPCPEWTNMNRNMVSPSEPSRCIGDASYDISESSRTKLLAKSADT